MNVRRNGCVPPALKQDYQRFNVATTNTATISNKSHQGQYTIWFLTSTTSSIRCLYATTKNNDSIDELRNKADQLRLEAEKIRQDLETKRQNENQSTTSERNGMNTMSASPTAVVDAPSKRSTPWNIQEMDNNDTNNPDKVDELIQDLQ